MSFDILTKDEAASRARISRRYLDKRIAAGTGPEVLHIGRRALVRSDVLQAWLERLTAQQEAASSHDAHHAAEGGAVSDILQAAAGPMDLF